MYSCQVISIDWAPERFSTYVLPRVFIRHQRPENSPLTTKNSLANVQLAYDYFLSRHGIFSCLQHYTFLLLLGFLVKTMPLAQKTPDRNNIFISSTCQTFTTFMNNIFFTVQISSSALIWTTECLPKYHYL